MKGLYLVREHDPRLCDVERSRQPGSDAAREAATRGGLEGGQVGDEARRGSSSREEELESLVEGELQAREGDLKRGRSRQSAYDQQPASDDFCKAEE